MIELSNADLTQLISAAMDSPRKRSHHSLHSSLDAKVQRLAIAMEPDTYVRPPVTRKHGNCIFRCEAHSRLSCSMRPV